MSNPTTGEWTAERIINTLGLPDKFRDKYASELADEINAALAEREKSGTWTLQDGKPELLNGDIEKLKTPDYHQLNEHAGRNDRLLHAVLCAYVKHHYYEDNHIGWDELDRILFDAICNEIGDDAFCEWTDNLK